MSLSPNSNALALKRKLQQADHRPELATKRRHPSGYNPQAPWLSDATPRGGWRTIGDPAVHSSLPLANMVSAVQDLIDPDFDPLTAILDEEPRFLKPLPDRIAPEDLEFLRFRGALSIPETTLRNELLRAYIQWVHSFMPVLNLQEFLRCVAENDPDGKISILLFQAVMFVGTAFVDLEHLQAAGYATRKSARNAFFTRLRLLYSLDCEEDRIVILQTVLLMTYWSDPENSLQRDIWDWIGVCNTQAHSIGLNQDSTSANDIDARTRRLRTRLWWCMYSRDRLIAMGMRRPLQVNEGTSSVPILKLEDFDFEPFSESAVALFHCRQLEDVSRQKRLATMFIEKVKLCQCIGRVLFAQYAPSQRQFGATDRTTVTLVPRQASDSEFTRCTQKLDTWLNSLPKDAQYIPSSRGDFRNGEDVLLLHGAMLRMLYHATSSALHRPWAAASKDESKSRTEWRNTARKKLHDAATGITHIIQGLNQLNLTRFLPQSGVTVILPAAVAHLSNSMSENPAVRESGIYNFQRCIQVLHCLKDIYPAANMEFQNLEAAVKVQSGSCNSNTFFQIMQYNFDTPNEPRKSSNTDLAPISHSGQPPEDGPSQSPNKHTPSPKEPSPHEHENQQQRKPSMEISNEITHLNRRPFPNDFDDHYATTDSAENPFTFFSVDFDAFSNVENNPPETLDVSLSDHDLENTDWTQALFKCTSLPKLDGTTTFDERPRTQSVSYSQNDQKQYPFNFDLDEDHDHGTLRHQSISLGNAGITGDLDRDLGFQTGDETF